MKFTYINVFSDNVREVINSIGQENIFKLIFEDVSFSKRYCSPFREDKNPGCYFEVSPNNRLYFIDFASAEDRKYDCISAIQKYFNLDFLGAFNFIREHFQDKDLKQDAKLLKDSEQILIPREKIIRPIYFSTRNWNSEDKLFWSEIGITRLQLEEDKVFPIDLYTYYSKEGISYSKRPFSITYAYVLPKNRIKIYSPKTTNPRDKWLTNCLVEDLGNIENIDLTGDQLIITKSYKDCRVLRNLGYKNTIWVQGETQLPPIEMLLDLMKRFKKIIIFFDNDTQGILSSDKLVGLINELIPGKGFKIQIPTSYKEKDISDFYKQFQENQTKKFIKKLLKNK